MTDLEITERCAEAMGWKHLGAVGHDCKADGIKCASEAEERYGPKQLWCLSGGNDWWLDEEGRHMCGVCSSIPAPLGNDAHAMALVKRFGIQLWRDQDRVTWHAYTRGNNHESADLNRAISNCAAALAYA